MYDFYGAVKVKDGLFMGDEFAAADADMFASNKIGFVVNCTGKRIANHFEDMSVRYKNLSLIDQESFTLQDDLIQEVFEFVAQSEVTGESVLVHSIRQSDYAILITTTYLMKRYLWTASKTIEYLKKRKPGLEFQNLSQRQLAAFERRLAAASPPLSFDWSSPRTEDELLIHNTYINMRPINTNGKFYHSIGTRLFSRILHWRDAKLGSLEDSDHLPDTRRLFIKSILKRQTPVARPMSATLCGSAESLKTENVPGNFNSKLVRNPFSQTTSRPPAAPNTSRLSATAFVQPRENSDVTFKSTVNSRPPLKPAIKFQAPAAGRDALPDSTWSSGTPRLFARSPSPMQPRARWRS